MIPASRLLRLCFLLSFLLHLPACSNVKTSQTEKVEPVQRLIVLPVIGEAEESNGAPLRRSDLTAGVAALDTALQDQLAGRKDVEFVLAVDPRFNELEGVNRLTYIQDIGRAQHSDAVLTCRLSRYAERRGKEYGAEEPASVAFDCKLISVASGRALCFFTFDETQQALTENVLQLTDAARRGLKWLTARELLVDGLKGKLANCPYLGKE